MHTHSHTHTGTRVGSSTGPRPESPHRCLRTPWGPTPPRSLSRRVSPSPSSSRGWSTWSTQVPGDGSGGGAGLLHRGWGGGVSPLTPTLLGPHLALPQQGTVRGGRGPCRTRGGAEGREGPGENTRSGDGGTKHCPQAEGTRHTGVRGTSVYSPNRPTWVSMRERSSSCMWRACQGAGLALEGGGSLLPVSPPSGLNPPPLRTSTFRTDGSGASSGQSGSSW